MKKLFFIILAFSYFHGTSQDKPFNRSLLLCKNGASSPVTLSIMPNEPIKIRAIDGQKFTLYDYSLIGDSAIASVTDTIALKDITSLKGKVKKNAFRKISGVVLFGAGASLAVIYTIVGIAFSAPEALLISVPAVGVAYAGRALAEARRFETTRKWSLSISPK